MSKRNFVCFRCRTAVRREPNSDEPVRCPGCRDACHNIGYKIPVPPKSKPDAWKRLHEEFFSERQEADQEQSLSKVRRKHTLEQEIAKLEDRPENNGRAKEIKRLRRKLEAFET